jgi:predicted Na+-dependent transporter
MTTVGILQTLYIWTLISLLPATLPLISNSVLTKWITFTLGIIIKLIESTISVIYLFDSANEFYKLFGVTMIMFFGVIGLIGIIYSFRWLKMKKE